MHGFRALIDLHLALQAERESARKQERLRADIAALDQRLAAAREVVVAAEAELKRIQHDRRSIEGDVAQIEQVRRRYRDQLMEAKTNEVYRTLLHEIETTGQRISEKETTILELMEAADAATASIEKAKRDLAEAERAATAEAARLNAEIEAEERLRGAARARAAGAEPGVPPDLLVQFRRIAQARGGKGMARAVEHGCEECHVAVRPQVWVEIAYGEARACAGCGRLLYRDDVPAPAVAEAPPSATSAG